jgi:regulatory protein
MISTMRIESLKTEPDRAGRFWATLDDGSRIALYRQTIEDLGLYSGMELTDDELLKLKENAGAVSAKMRAVRIVAASSVSKRDLKQRLIQKGEDPSQAAQAVAWMEEMHLVDDAETARQIVNRCAGRGYGLARAKQALYEKKIPRQYWDTALEDYPDQMENIMSFLRARLSDGTDQREIKRATDALLRRGHCYSDIRRALSRFSIGEDFPEE